MLGKTHTKGPPYNPPRGPAIFTSEIDIKYEKLMYAPHLHINGQQPWEYYAYHILFTNYKLQILDIVLYKIING